MTYNIDPKIEKIRVGLEAAEKKLRKFEEMGEKAHGKLSDSFEERLDDLREQKSILMDHLAQLEKEKIQSWKQSNFGNDMVDVARKLIDRVDKLLGRDSDRPD